MTEQPIRPRFRTAVLRPSAASLRRLLFFACWLSVTGLGTVLFADFLWRTELYGLKYLLLFLFVLLFAQIALGFCHAFFGFLIRRFRKTSPILATLDRADLNANLPPTALLFPIYNEDVPRVFAGIRATFESLRERGLDDAFDVFILSDTRRPDRWIEEQLAWKELCRELNAVDRIHYRRRVANTGKKAGNVADFLERWGSRYRYFIVFDADSLMEGQTLETLVRLMEANPTVGILQTVPGLVRSESLFARVQQFANRTYGPLFSSGLDLWQQSEGNYWGHNAILRTEPFIRHCALPRLPWREPIGGSILSHDFVEAALMRRAGYEVWLAPDLEGSFEEGPPNLLESVQRDQRWAQGNLQHSWLLFAREFTWANKAHFLNGIFAYLGSLFWFLFLLTGTFVVEQFERSGLSLIAVSGFTRWFHLSLTEHGLLLLAFTLAVLFAPKVLSVTDLLLDRDRRRRHGGPWRILAGSLVETAISAVTAPLFMLFHTEILLRILLGAKSSWDTQNRSGGSIPLASLLRAHGKQVLLALAWGTLAWSSQELFFLWMLPVLLPLLLSPLITALLARRPPEALLRRTGLLKAPEEFSPPAILDKLPRYESAIRTSLDSYPQPRDRLPFEHPLVHALHLTLLRPTGNTSAQVQVLGPAPEPEENGKTFSDLPPARRAQLLSRPNWVKEQFRNYWTTRPATQASIQP